MIMLASPVHKEWPSEGGASRQGGPGASATVLVREVSAGCFGDLLDLVPVLGCENAEVKWRFPKHGGTPKWWFPYMTVPRNRWFIRDNPNQKWMIWGYSYLRKPPKSSTIMGQSSWIFHKKPTALGNPFM